MYESILRLTYNKLNVMTVPRVGYNHVNFREDSLFWGIRYGEEDKISEDECGLLDNNGQGRIYLH